jgi:trimethylamine--corrinoid protein Co-methyltransferase
MRAASAPMAAIEAQRLNVGYVAIAKSLGLPTQAYMALSDSKFNDPQAGMESGVGAFLAAAAGINSVSGPGMLDYVNCFSFEKLVFDDEVVAHALRFVRPVEPKGDLPAGPLMEELVRDKHLLTSEHTLERWPEELYLPGPMVDRTNWDQWQAQGSRDWQARARETIDERLDSYEEPPLPAATHAEIRRLFETTCSEKEMVLPDFPRPGR